jgi:hypothetical protein
MDEIEDLQADPSHPAKQWHILDITLLASSMIYLMGSAVLAGGIALPIIFIWVFRE